MKRYRGFTIIELMVACAVIMILASILFLGARHMSNSAKVNSTRTMLQNLQAMVTERQAAVGASKVRQEMNDILNVVNNSAGIFNANNIKNVDRGSTSRYPAAPYATPLVATPQNNAVGAMQYMMALLMAQPSNKKTVASLPQQQLLEKQNSGDLPFNPPILLDGWGNPIIPVGTDGLDNVTFNGSSPQTISAPNRLPFFASAGADGDFRTGDDNIYSFQN